MMQLARRSRRSPPSQLLANAFDSHSQLWRMVYLPTRTLGLYMASMRTTSKFPEKVLLRSNWSEKWTILVLHLGTAEAG